MNGHEAILRQFLANGITYMFGNPGTVEQGFLDALADVPEMRYILTLKNRLLSSARMDLPGPPLDQRWYKFIAHQDLVTQSATSIRHTVGNLR